MQEQFGRGGYGLPEVVWKAVNSSVRDSGEEVIAERRGGTSARPQSSDRHGLSRHEVFSGWFLALFAPLLGILSGMTAITAERVVDATVLAAGACICLYGAGWAAVWCWRARREARRDSMMRRYILTGKRLLVVGSDSFVEVPLSGIARVRLKEHWDGTGTVVCTYRHSINTKTIAIEGVEGSAEFKQSLEDSRAALEDYAFEDQAARYQGEEAVGR